MNGNGVPLARAIRGPVTLITLGVLFAFNNFTAWGFEKTWPVLLIVFGLLSLLRRAEPAAYAPPPAAYAPPYAPAPPPYNPPPAYNAPPAGPAGRGGFGTSAPPRAAEPAPRAAEPPAPGGVS